MAVICAAGTVLARGAAELRHGDQRDVFCVVAEVSPECRDGRREIAEAIGKLAIDCALVLMRVPSADIGKRSLNAEVRLEQLSDLLHVVAEFGVGILDAGGGLVLGGIGVAQHLDGVKCLFAGGVKDVIAGLAIHGCKSVGSGRWRGTAGADSEVVDIGESDGGNVSGECARDLGAEGQCAKSRVLADCGGGLLTEVRG